MPTHPTDEAPIRDVLIATLCRLTAIDRIGLGFAAAFLFLFTAVALTAHLAIGDAPEGRLWGYLFSWAAIGFGIGVAGPWALCRALHAAGHTARLAWKRRERMQQTVPGFLHGRMA